MSLSGMAFVRLAPEADRVNAHAMVPHTQVREAKTAQRYARLTPELEPVLYAERNSHQSTVSASTRLMQPYDGSFLRVYGLVHLKRLVTSNCA